MKFETPWLNVDLAIERHDSLYAVIDEFDAENRVSRVGKLKRIAGTVIGCLDAASPYEREEYVERA
ncbi:MAG: hypothetical protein VXZ82_20600 [Planctomycetota bacterium]|nr:hypothetical protein [Planctomycetota bacterium]